MLPAHVLGIEGELVGIALFAVGGLIWTLAPFLDSPSRRGEHSRLFVGFGVLVVAFIIVMTVLGYVLE